MSSFWRIAGNRVKRQPRCALTDHLHALIMPSFARRRSSIGCFIPAIWVREFGFQVCYCRHTQSAFDEVSSSSADLRMAAVNYGSMSRD